MKTLEDLRWPAGLTRRVGETEARDYTRAGGLNYSFQGLARYWTKRANAKC